MFHYNHMTEGTCARLVSFDLDGERVRNISFVGGCDGNLKALSTVLEGVTVSELASKLEGLTCGRKSTSCADQLAKAAKAGLIAKNDPNYISPLELDD